MAEQIDHEAMNPIPPMPFGLHNVIAKIFGLRFILYAYDYVMMRFTSSKRHRQLAFDKLTCRFCNSDIDLLGMWKCSCGYSRPGHYFGRCPNCLGHPPYIDCPACRSTMDVR